MYLIRFTYDYYCQGYEDAQQILLVRDVHSFPAACHKVKTEYSHEYRNARDFEDLTIN